jgi:hypothetical protein
MEDLVAKIELNYFECRRQCNKFNKQIKLLGIRLKPEQKAEKNRLEAMKCPIAYRMEGARRTLHYLAHMDKSHSTENNMEFHRVLLEKYKNWRKAQE